MKIIILLVEKFGEYKQVYFFLKKCFFNYYFPKKLETERGFVLVYVFCKFLKSCVSLSPLRARKELLQFSCGVFHWRDNLLSLRWIVSDIICWVDVRFLYVC